MIASAILFPQMAEAKLANFTAPVDYAAADSSIEQPKGEAYIFAKNLNNTIPEIIVNAANIYALVEYLEELPNAMENEFTQFNTTVNTQINQAKTEVTNQIDQTKTEINNKIAQNKTDVNNQITQAKTDVNNQITQAKTETNTQISQVQTTLSGKLNELSQKQSENLTLINNQIQQLQGNWGDQLSQMAANTNLLSNQISKLNAELDKKFNRTMASQAAFANLFQPYKVGKLNLTASVGGYKSTHAVAIGTGYRFNEKVALRASASFIKNGSAAYGAGINFEY